VNRGFTLLEVMAALGLAAAAGLIATAGGSAMMRLSAAAHSEAVGLAAASGKPPKELVGAFRVVFP